MNTDSKRNSLRLPIKMKVKITTETFCTRQLITEDFSDGGIFIIDNEIAKLPAGSLISVQADEGMQDAPIIKARIAWTNKKGAGLEYLLES